MALKRRVTRAGRRSAYWSSAEAVVRCAEPPPVSHSGIAGRHQPAV